MDFQFVAVLQMNYNKRFSLKIFAMHCEGFHSLQSPFLPKSIAHESLAI